MNCSYNLFDISAGDKLPKYSLYGGFTGRPVFASHSAPLPSPLGRNDSTSGRDKDKESEIQSPGSDQLSDQMGSPRSLSSSDLESGSESDRQKDFSALDLNPAGSSSGHRDPTDVMAKIFPHHKRDVLESVVKNCKGDIVKAIEMMLNTKEDRCNPESVSISAGDHATLQKTAGFGLTGGTLGTFSAKSAFSPLQTPATSIGSDSIYGLNPRFGISPLRLAYSSSGGGITSFMSPYLTSGLVPAFPLRPPMDYSFPGMMRDLPYLQSKDLCNTSIYARLNHDK